MRASNRVKWSAARESAKRDSFDCGTLIRTAAAVLVMKRVKQQDAEKWNSETCMIQDHM